MSTDEGLWLRRSWLRRIAALGATAIAAPVFGQNAPAAGAAGAHNAPAAPDAAGIPGAAGHPNPLAGGTGMGYHSPLSAFAPLPQRSDVVPWSTLADFTTRTERQRVVQVYSAAILALDQRTVRLQGFMTPLDPGTRQVHFLLSSVPLTCPFCTPGGPESLVQVRARRPIRYSMGAVVVEGRFHVLHNDSLGFFYRITQAIEVD